MQNEGGHTLLFCNNQVSGLGRNNMRDGEGETAERFVIHMNFFFSITVDIMLNF